MSPANVNGGVGATHDSSTGETTILAPTTDQTLTYKWVVTLETGQSIEIDWEIQFLTTGIPSCPPLDSFTMSAGNAYYQVNRYEINGYNNVVSYYVLLETGILPTLTDDKT